MKQFAGSPAGFGFCPTPFGSLADRARGGDTEGAFAAPASWPNALAAGLLSVSRGQIAGLPRTILSTAPDGDRMPPGARPRKQPVCNGDADHSGNWSICHAVTAPLLAAPAIWRSSPDARPPGFPGGASGCPVVPPGGRPTAHGRLCPPVPPSAPRCHLAACPPQCFPVPGGARRSAACLAGVLLFAMIVFWKAA